MSNKNQQQASLDRVARAIDQIKNGGMVIMIDDEDRENEGDLVFAAEDTDAEKINFMICEARGLVCLPMEPSYIERLQLPLMSDQSKSQTPLATAFTVSIEAREGVSTGISAKDRAQTIQAAIADNSKPSDLVVPGHVFPLKAKSGGVLERAGHTEGAVDIAKLAGKKPAGVICEIMKSDGTMARVPDLEAFSEKFELPIVSIEDLIQFRLLNETYVEEVRREPVDTEYGKFHGVWFKTQLDRNCHFALINSEELGGKEVDIRVHKQRPLCDVFGKNTESRAKLDYGLRMLKEKEFAVLLYLSQENGAHAMLSEKFHGSNPESTGKMDPRLYGIGAQILRHLGVEKMRLHATSERGLVGLGGFGLQLMETIVMENA